MIEMTRQRFVELVGEFVKTRKDGDFEIRQIFLAFDVNNTGFLQVEDLKNILAEVAPHLDNGLAQGMFDKVDLDRDGRISFRDFEKIMRRAI